MKKFSLKYFFLSIISGLLLALSFPKINAFYFAWIAFIPIIYCALRSCVRNSLIYGFICGFVFYSVSLYWIFPFLQYNTNSNIQSLFSSAALCVYLAAYISLWAGLLSLSRRHFHPVLSTFFAASVWVTVEYIRTYFLTGFGWNLLGYSQHSFPYIIQFADIAGVYGISFIIVFVNMMFYYWLKDSKEKRYLIAVIIIFFLLLAYGVFKMRNFSNPYGEKISVGVVQPNIDQYKKWDGGYENEILKTLNDNALYFENKKMDLIVYPETALPGYLQSDTEIRGFINNVSPFAKISLIGAPRYDDDFIYNSVFAIKNDGTILDKHDKKHLVIFGEYIPFRKILAKYFGVLNTLGDFSKGKYMNVFSYNNISVGATICSENFFPDLSRRLALNGAKIFTNHTNDAWFFDSFAPYQHFVMNIFRAVENRKNIVVSANTGISAVIDSAGNIITSAPLNQNLSFTADAYQNDTITIYDRLGDIFSYICIVFTLFFTVLIFVI